TDRRNKVSQDFQTSGRRTSRRYPRMGVLSSIFVPANANKKQRVASVTTFQKILRRSGTILILLHLIDMKQASLLVTAVLLASLVIISDARTNTVERVVEFRSGNGTILKGTYFAAAKPGPGVLLFHQSNRTRKSWEDVARQLAAAGINVLTVDADPNKTRKQRWPGELDAAFEFLRSQSGVNRDVLGIGGAGVIGVEDSV